LTQWEVIYSLYYLALQVRQVLGVPQGVPQRLI
jgi:hypothetical protein